MLTMRIRFERFVELTEQELAAGAVPGTATEEVDEAIPAKYEICDRCQGLGQHTNPSIDGNGITGSEWAEWEPEERTAYMHGDYDVPCEAGCHAGKVLVPDFDVMSDAQRELVIEWNMFEDDQARDAAEDRRMRMMESGGWDR